MPAEQLAGQHFVLHPGASSVQEMQWPFSIECQCLALAFSCRLGSVRAPCRKQRRRSLLAIMSRQGQPCLQKRKETRGRLARKHFSTGAHPAAETPFYIAAASVSARGDAQCVWSHESSISSSYFPLELRRAISHESGLRKLH